MTDQEHGVNDNGDNRWTLRYLAAADEADRLWQQGLRDLLDDGMVVGSWPDGRPVVAHLAGARVRPAGKSIIVPEVEKLLDAGVRKTLDALTDEQHWMVTAGAVNGYIAGLAAVCRGETVLPAKVVTDKLVWTIAVATGVVTEGRTWVDVDRRARTMFLEAIGMGLIQGMEDGKSGTPVYGSDTITAIVIDACLRLGDSGMYREINGVRGGGQQGSGCHHDR